MSIWLRTINVAIVKQRSAVAYVISDDFPSYDDRRLLTRILIFLLFNKSYQLIFNRVISSDNNISVDSLQNHTSRLIISIVEKLFN